MKKYRLTTLGKIVLGGLLVFLISAFAYGMDSYGGFTGSKVLGIVRKDTLKPLIVTPASPKNDNASRVENIDNSFNLKKFLQYMPALAQTTEAVKNEKPNNKKVEVFFIPHADDELLSMGAGIADSVNKGNDVHVVLFTQGYETNAINFINGAVYCPWHKRVHSPSKEGYERLDEQDIGRLRVEEFKKSIEGLGVTKENVHILNFNADRVTEYEIMLIMLGFEKQFPGAMHNTASYHDLHPFHQKLGLSLMKLIKNKELSNARFFISPVQWNSIKGMFISGVNLTVVLRNSEKVYKQWEPENKHFAIGYHSYPQPFIKLEKQSSSKFHNPKE